MLDAPPWDRLEGSKAFMRSVIQRIATGPEMSKDISRDEARLAMDRVRDVKAPLGLLAEDLDPVAGEMWGNFPQAYSHVGLIHAAFAASPRWFEYGS